MSSFVNMRTKRQGIIDSIGLPNMAERISPFLISSNTWNILRMLVFSSKVLVKSKQNASTSSFSVILQTIILILAGWSNGSFLKFNPSFCEHKYFKKVKLLRQWLDLSLENLEKRVFLLIRG